MREVKWSALTEKNLVLRHWRIACSLRCSKWRKLGNNLSKWDLHGKCRHSPSTSSLHDSVVIAIFEIFCFTATSQYKNFYYLYIAHEGESFYLKNKNEGEKFFILRPMCFTHAMTIIDFVTMLLQFSDPKVQYLRSSAIANLPHKISTFKIFFTSYFFYFFNFLDPIVDIKS